MPNKIFFEISFFVFHRKKKVRCLEEHMNSDHPAPLWNPMQTPTSWNMDPLPSPPLPPRQTPSNLTTPKKKLWTFFCAIQVCYTQVSGPVQTTCSNTLSSMH